MRERDRVNDQARGRGRLDEPRAVAKQVVHKGARRKWWTRSQRIRTAGELPFEAVLFEASVPVYQRIAREARHLRVLNFNLTKIARHLGVTEKTVARALGWIGRGQLSP